MSVNQPFALDWSARSYIKFMQSLKREAVTPGTFEWIILNKPKEERQGNILVLNFPCFPKLVSQEVTEKSQTTNWLLSNCLVKQTEIYHNSISPSVAEK